MEVLTSQGLSNMPPHATIEEDYLDSSSDEEIEPTENHRPIATRSLTLNNAHVAEVRNAVSSISTERLTEKRSPEKISPYPFCTISKTMRPLMMATRLKHTTKPTKFPFKFTVSEALHSRLVQGDSIISLGCFKISEPLKAVPSPQHIEYTIDGQPFQFTPKNYLTNLGYDVTAMCSAVGSHTLTILPNECCCSFAFGILILDVTPISSLLDYITTHHRLSEEHCQNRIKDLFQATDGIEQISQQISLKCPLTLGRIGTPVRGDQCRHIQCFDLESYLSINRKSPKFQCPVCSQDAQFDQLRIDSYFLRLLADSSQTDVIVHPDATWTSATSSNPQSPQKRCLDRTDPLCKRQHTIEVVDLT
eukprot:TRINITY_DN17259_c0_g1_i1.p1 TRINITY_DN17259_c0_g1~~TRINITY_DN17259_c0_g1_i1.p1  ORF type:complete len:362 (+),score=52.03 TRINITY_DN17259_c0_g1_i1:2-1087(+)